MLENWKFVLVASFPPVRCCYHRTEATSLSVMDINEDPFWNHTLGPRSDLCFFWPMTACQKKSFIIGSPCTQMLHFAPFSLNYVKSLFSLGLSHWSTSGWCALREALCKCIDTNQVRFTDYLLKNENW